MHNVIVVQLAELACQVLNAAISFTENEFDTKLVALASSGI
jgi:hypothetical protein